MSKCNSIWQRRKRFTLLLLPCQLIFLWCSAYSEHKDSNHSVVVQILFNPFNQTSARLYHPMHPVMCYCHVLHICEWWALVKAAWVLIMYPTALFYVFNISSSLNLWSPHGRKTIVISLDIINMLWRPWCVYCVATSTGRCLFWVRQASDFKLKLPINMSHLISKHCLFGLAFR